MATIGKFGLLLMLESGQNDQVPKWNNWFKTIQWWDQPWNLAVELISLKCSVLKQSSPFNIKVLNSRSVTCLLSCTLATSWYDQPITPTCRNLNLEWDSDYLGMNISTNGFNFSDHLNSHTELKASKLVRFLYLKLTRQPDLGFTIQS